MESPTYVGIDIGWKVDPDPDSTGLCTIQGDELIDCSLTRANTEIVEYAISQGPDFIGVDAPLIVSNEEGERPVESELKNGGHSVFSANREWFNEWYGGIRGEELVDEFEEHGYRLSADTSRKQAVIEVYPRPTIEAILGKVPKYKNGRKDEIASGLRDLWDSTDDRISEVDFHQFKNIVPYDPDDVTKTHLKKIGDLIDAFYSAYVVKIDYEGHGRTQVYGDLESGSILLATDPEGR